MTRPRAAPGAVAVPLLHAFTHPSWWAFERLRTNLELTGLQERIVAVRQKSVRAAVERQLTVVDSFSDRVIAAADAHPSALTDLRRCRRPRCELQKSRPHAVTERTSKALLAEYPKGTKISRNGQAVTITITDFIVDVVPALARPWWSTWDEESWHICDSGSDGWIATSPKRHVAISSKANALRDGDLVRRIKQLKAWNRTVLAPLRSFHLEAPAVGLRQVVVVVSLRAIDWDSARYFFKKMRETPAAAP